MPSTRASWHGPAVGCGEGGWAQACTGTSAPSHELSGSPRILTTSSGVLELLSTGSSAQTVLGTWGWCRDWTRWGAAGGVTPVEHAEVVPGALPSV